MPNTGVSELTKRVFVELDGVSDGWINSLQVEKVAGGQTPPDQEIRVLAELIRSGEKDCCLFSASSGHAESIVAGILL